MQQYPLESDGSPWRRLASANLVPGGVVLDAQRVHPSDPDRYGPNGYVTLVIDGEILTELVHAPGNQVLRTTSLG